MGSEARGPSHLGALLLFAVFWTVALISVTRYHSSSPAAQWVMPAPDSARLLRSPAQAAGTAQCITRHAYISSELEKAWLGNISSWQDDFCSNLAHTEQLTQAWMQAAVAYHTALQQGSGNPAAALEQQRLLDPRIFSQIRTTIDCGSSSGSSEQVTWIEPLAHGLRHPDSTCNRGASVFNRTYLMISHSSEVSSTRQRSQQTCKGRDCQAIYLDLGATTLEQGPEEPGQGWFFHTYAKQGIRFDRYLLWEAVTRQPEEVFRNVPKQELDRYQYFNIPVTADTADPSNPVHILKRVAQPGDFVVFKLDIDNWQIEAALMKALLADQEALQLIDEFYFEDHVNFSEMHGWWAWNQQFDPNRTLADSYQQFLALRQMGIRAHPWV